MRKIYFLPALFLAICCLFSCQKDGGKGGLSFKSSSIVGQWNLQHQKTQVFIDGVLGMDTAFVASPNNYARVQFNSDGTFNSVSYWLDPTGGNNLGGGVSNVVSRDSTYGTYSVASSKLTLDASIAGFGTASSFVTGTTVPLFSLDSGSSKISQLTTATLIIHMEYSYKVVYAGQSKLYKSEIDYYYGK